MFLCHKETNNIFIDKIILKIFFIINFKVLLVNALCVTKTRIKWIYSILMRVFEICLTKQVTKLP